MARISIYVPDDLKARMDEAGELNWSAAAQRAFEIEINLHRWKMETDMIEKATARLRASKMEGDEQLKKEGRSDGQSWARNTADYYALKRIAEFDWSHANPQLGSLAVLIDLIAGGEEGMGGEILDEIRDPEDKSEIEEAWLEGFIEGATDVWNEVADKV